MKRKKINLSEIPLPKNSGKDIPFETGPKIIEYTVKLNEHVKDR